MSTLKAHGLLEVPVAEITARLRVAAEVAEAVDGAALMQECVPEREDLKRPLFSELAELTGRHCVLASSSSFMTTSTSAAGTGAESRALVAHPGNPPFAIPVIELVPNPQTTPETVQRAVESRIVVYGV
nr:3-hydroxyacyl-CoA dehydrogenase NAD-binding domain-containing protein [Brevibacterium sp. Ap13]